MSNVIERHGEMVMRTRSEDLAMPATVMMHGAIGLAGEVGEVCEMIKKHLWHGRSLDRDALEKEIGDVLWYLHSLAEGSGISLASAFETNIAKLEKRHPNGFTTDY